MNRYAVLIRGTAPEGAAQYSNKAKALRDAKALAAKGKRVEVLDYKHPDLKGIEYARIIWHG